MAKERLYFKIEIGCQRIGLEKAYHYSCYNRTELHEFINEQMELLAFEWAKEHYWAYANSFEDEYAFAEVVLSKLNTRIFEVPPKEFYSVDYATMRV
jgi:radical SAM superfamily enzyme